MGLKADRDTVDAAEDGKSTGLESGRAGNVAHDAEVVADWAKDEHNPDYMLAQIHAANDGFEAQMKVKDGHTKGSYLISAFTRNYDGKRFLYEVFDEAQRNLHRRGKQLTENTYNNGTRYLKFVKHSTDDDACDKIGAPMFIEMTSSKNNAVGECGEFVD